jgi:type II secretory pathway pseudopilin PulG
MSMEEHLSDRQIERCQQRLLPAAEQRRADDHLAGCAECRAKLHRFARTQSLLASVALSPDDPWRVVAEPEDFTPPSAEQTPAYSDSRAEETERAAPPVQAMRAESKPSPLPEHPRPAARRETDSLHRGLLAAIAIAGALLLLALIALWSFIRENRELKSSLAAARQENEKLQQRVTDAEKNPAQLNNPIASPQPSLSQAPTSLSVALNDAGGQVALDQQGNLVGLGTLPFLQQQLLKDALSGGQVDTSMLATDLDGKPDAKSGEANDDAPLRLVSPVGKTIITDRPTLRWQPLTGAIGYVVTIYDESLNKVTASDQLTATSWTVTQPLARGRIFTWQIKAVREGEESGAPASEARFKILDQVRVEELNQAKREHPEAHLLLGLLYARAGLADEAEREMKTLARLNPDSEIVRKLMQSIRAARRKV